MSEIQPTKTQADAHFKLRVARAVAWREGFRYGLAAGIVLTLMAITVLYVLTGL